MITWVYFWKSLQIFFTPCISVVPFDWISKWMTSSSSNLFASISSDFIALGMEWISAPEWIELVFVSSRLALLYWNILECESHAFRKTWVAMPKRQMTRPKKLVLLIWSPLKLTARYSVKISLNIPAIDSVRLDVKDNKRYSENSIKNASREPIIIKCIVCHNPAKSWPGSGTDDAELCIKGRTSKKNARGNNPTNIHGCMWNIMSIGWLRAKDIRH